MTRQEFLQQQSKLKARVKAARTDRDRLVTKERSRLQSLVHQKLREEIYGR